MAATRKEITDLMWQHKAIREHMKFLTNSLSSLTTQPRTAQSIQLKDQITLYRWRLYDFREGVRRHIDLDERIFETLLGTSVEDIIGEHETIQKQIDNGITRLAESHHTLYGFGQEGRGTMLCTRVSTYLIRGPKSLHGVSLPT